MQFTKLIANHRCTLGENLIWDAQLAAYFFIDIDECRIHRYTPASQSLSTWQLDETIGFMALVEDHLAVIGLTSGIYLYHLDNETKQWIAHPLEGEPDRIRYNDAKVSPDGWLFFSSMDQSSERAPIAYLYCMSPEGEIATLRQGVRVGNGIAFDLDRDRLYFADTRAPGIFMASYSQALEAAKAGVEPEFGLFYEATDLIGRPDGGTVDAQGRYWSAGVSAGNLNAFSPEGELLASYPLPVQAPSIPCIGGADLNQLTLATIAKDTKDDLEGAVLIADEPIPGLVNPRYQYRF